MVSSLTAYTVPVQSEGDRAMPSLQVTDYWVALVSRQNGFERRVGPIGNEAIIQDSPDWNNAQVNSHKPEMIYWK